MNGKVRGVSVFLSVLMLFACFTGFSALAAYDIDFTIKPEETTVSQGQTFNVNIVVTTASSNGYVNFLFKLMYDETVFSCESTYSEGGYTGSGTNGIYTLEYSDPTQEGTEYTPTSRGDIVTIPVKLKVLNDAKVGSTKISGSIESCNGIDTLDLNKEVKLALANLSTKTVTIQEDDGTYTASSETPAQTPDDTETEDDPAQELMTQIPSPTASTENDGASWGLIIGIIFGGIVVFCMGIIVGYILGIKSHGGEDPDDYAPQGGGDPYNDRYYDEDSDYNYPTRGVGSHSRNVNGRQQSMMTQPYRQNRQYQNNSTAQGQYSYEDSRTVRNSGQYGGLPRSNPSDRYQSEAFRRPVNSHQSEARRYQENPNDNRYYQSGTSRDNYRQEDRSQMNNTNGRNQQINSGYRPTPPSNRNQQNNTSGDYRPSEPARRDPRMGNYDNRDYRE